MQTPRATLIFVTPAAGRTCRNDRTAYEPALKSLSIHLV